MTSERRIVRTLPSFFNDVDRQFPPERGSNGEPSAVDFQSYDLLEIVELFATGFDDLPELIVGRPDYRVMISAGRMVSAFSVVGQLAPTKQSNSLLSKSKMMRVVTNPKKEGSAGYR